MIGYNIITANKTKKRDGPCLKNKRFGTSFSCVMRLICRKNKTEVFRIYLFQNIDLKIVILKLIIRYDCRLKKKTRETKKENKSWQRQRKDY